jgi:hypothetical protein
MGYVITFGLTITVLKATTLSVIGYKFKTSSATAQGNHIWVFPVTGNSGLIGCKRRRAGLASLFYHPYFQKVR